MELLDECAREKAGMGDDWSPYQYKCLPEHPQETELLEVTGAVAPLKTRGKNKGNRNWDKMDRATKRTVYVTLTEHAEWVAKWERETGKCSKCKGSGQAWIGWGVTTGHRYEECRKCSRTGKSNTEMRDRPRKINNEAQD